MGRDKVFALDWLGFARDGVLGDVLRLFSFRYAWIKNRDPKAYSELVRSRRAADPDIRRVAELLLADLDRDDKREGPSAGSSKHPSET